METNILLSILVPTIPNRITYFYPRLMNDLLNQIKEYNNIELIALFDNKKRTIGKKRQEMINMVQGKYIVFIDDDDRISSDYIREIMFAINLNIDVDCIVFNTETCINHSSTKVLCKYGIEFEKNGYINKTNTEWRGKPAHTMVWKSDIVKSHQYNNLAHGEDVDWVYKAYKDIKKQHRIDKVLYYYDANYATTSECPAPNTPSLSDEIIQNNIKKLQNIL